MAYTLGSKCTKNLCKQTVLVQLIIENVVTCFLRHSVYTCVQLSCCINLISRFFNVSIFLSGFIVFRGINILGLKFEFSTTFRLCGINRRTRRSA